MGAVTFSISKVSRSGAPVRGALVASGAHTSSTSASNLTDGAAGAGSAVTPRAGDVLTLRVDETARVAFGGEAATATSGQIVFADETTDLEVSGTGLVSIVDVA